MLRVYAGNDRHYYVTDMQDDEAGDPPVVGLIPVLVACKHTTRRENGLHVRAALPDSAIYPSEARECLAAGDVVRVWINPREITAIEDLD